MRYSWVFLVIAVVAQNSTNQNGTAVYSFDSSFTVAFSEASKYCIEMEMELVNLKNQRDFDDLKSFIFTKAQSNCTHIWFEGIEMESWFYNQNQTSFPASEDDVYCFMPQNKDVTDMCKVVKYKKDVDQMFIDRILCNSFNFVVCH